MTTTISALTEMTSGQLDADADFVGIDDTDATATKKIKPEILVADALAQQSSALDLNGQNLTNVGTVGGRDLATDGTKLDGIEAAADVTDAANVAAAGALMADGSVSATGNLNMSGNQINGIGAVDCSGTLNMLGTGDIDNAASVDSQVFQGGVETLAAAGVTVAKMATIFSGLSANIASDDLPAAAGGNAGVFKFVVNKDATYTVVIGSKTLSQDDFWFGFSTGSEWVEIASNGA